MAVRSCCCCCFFFGGGRGGDQHKVPASDVSEHRISFTYRNELFPILFDFKCCNYNQEFKDVWRPILYFIEDFFSQVIELDKHLLSSLVVWRTDGCLLVLTQSLWHWSSISLKQRLDTSFICGIFRTAWAKAGTPFIAFLHNCILPSNVNVGGGFVIFNLQFDFNNDNSMN